jgi:muramoyltetrapeptide carboxypeptidase
MAGARDAFNAVMLPFAVPPLVVPPPLVPGDVVRIIAPAGPSDRAALWPGLAWVRTRYGLRLRPGVLDRDGYLAGADTRRRIEIERALGGNDAKAILATRGGYGSMRAIDPDVWSDFASRPKWVVGHSDITVLHAMAWRAGVASIHGPNATGLGRAAPADRASFIRCLEEPGRPSVWRGLRTVASGSARGIVIGGNLALLCAMAAAGLLYVPPGAVLAIEDVNEAPYRIDRMLTSLLLGGYLAKLAGVIVGGFDGSVPGPDGRTADQVIEERLGDLGLPVLAGAPFGHGKRNEAFVLGSTVTLENDEVRFGE